MARRDPGNKPAFRIGMAWIGVLLIVLVLLGVFATRIARPLSHESVEPRNTTG